MNLSGENVCRGGAPVLADLELMQVDNNCGIDFDGYIHCRDANGNDVAGTPTDSGYVQVVQGDYANCALDREGQCNVLGIPKLGPRYSISTFVCRICIYLWSFLLTVTFIVGRGFNAVGHLEGDYVQFQSHNGLTCATEESGRTDCFTVADYSICLKKFAMTYMIWMVMG